MAVGSFPRAALRFSSTPQTKTCLWGPRPGLTSMAPCGGAVGRATRWGGSRLPTHSIGKNRMDGARGLLCGLEGNAEARLAAYCLALFADAAHGLDFFDIGEGVGNFAGGFAHVDGDDSDLAGGGLGFGEERLYVTSDGDDVEVHGLADEVWGFVDLLDDSVEEVFDFGKLELCVGPQGEQAAIGTPAGGSDVLFFG